jgi:transcription antitermination factor NusB
MTNNLLSNRRNTRENLLMFFYSKEFLNMSTDFTDDDTKFFLNTITEIKREDKLDSVRESIKEVFDNVKITKLEPNDKIEFQLPYIKDKITMSFEDMDNQNAADGFMNCAQIYINKYKLNESDIIEEEISMSNKENLSFFRSYIKNYFTHIEEIDADIKNNLENWDFGRISIIDKIILRMGIVELRYFNEIPPKVIINEAIELGKKYSTEKSNIFINGILNKLKDMIRKTENN